MRRPADEELMRAVQDGDVDAFEVIVERYKLVVFNLAFSMLRSREDAEDAAQDTFLKLYRAVASYDPSRLLEPWLLRIAGNTCRDRLRRRAAAALPMVRDDEAEDLSQAIEDPRAAAVFGKQATEQAVRFVVEQLSERLRTPLLLKYVNGLTNAQIAAALGISLSNVKVRLARGKDLLQRQLERVLES